MRTTPEYNLIVGPNKSLILEVIVPGLNKNEIDLSFNSNELRLKTNKTPRQSKAYIRRGIVSPCYDYTWIVEPNLKLDMATLNNGILEVMFSPKIPLPSEPSGKIEIQ